MPRLSNIVWSSIAGNDDGKYFLWAIAYVIFVFLLGVVELYLYKNTRPGLTTWAFALPGVVGVPIVIAADSGLHLLLRILVVVPWILLFSWAFRFAYSMAKEKHKSDATHSTESG
jgi:drug/metabolite transporter (DMT)-like permease